MLLCNKVLLCKKVVLYVPHITTKNIAVGSAMISTIISKKYLPFVHEIICHFSHTFSFDLLQIIIKRTVLERISLRTTV